MNPVKELAAYGIFGVLTTLINIAVYKLAIWLGLGYGLANTIAFVISVLFAFFTNRSYVFLSERVGLKAILIEMGHFFAARMLTFLVETAGLYIMIDYMGMESSSPKYLMTVVVIILNYIISKLIVFKA